MEELIRHNASYCQWFSATCITEVILLIFSMRSLQFIPCLPTQISFFFGLTIGSLIKKEKKKPWKLLYLQQMSKGSATPNVNCFHLWERDLIFSFIFKISDSFILPSNQEKSLNITVPKNLINFLSLPNRNIILH